VKPFAALLFSATLLAAPTWDVRQHIPLSDFLVQAHRGAGDLAPENSLESFQLAWRLGAVPEADLRTTRDGVIVAFHDNDFRRILPSRPHDTIQQLPWSEVSRLDVGAFKGPHFAGQRVPSLAQLVQSLTGRRRLYIDIKNVDLAQLARETRPSGAAARMILASTDYALIRRWKQLAPESPAILWMGGSEAALEARFAELRCTSFADLTQLQIHVRLGPDGALRPSPEFLARAGAELRRYGILFQVFPWGVRDRAVFSRLLDLGVASFATDSPDLVLDFVRQYYGFSSHACAHRGDQESAPENTVPAFESAVRNGARQIEFDVKFTRDHRLVILHDPTLNRTTNGRGPLAQLDFAQARALDAGAWFHPRFAGTRIPTLEETLDAIPPGILLNVHLADQPGLAAAVARVLAARHRTADAFLACTPGQAVEAAAVAPGLTICNMARQAGDAAKYVENTIALGARFIQLRDVAGAPPVDLAALCRRLHQAGVTINYFGAQDEAKIRALAAAGVDYILTDRLTLCRRTLGEPKPDDGKAEPTEPSSRVVGR
jgi:glycerophosphoryl diester phosphodiesterase